MVLLILMNMMLLIMSMLYEYTLYESCKSMGSASLMRHVTTPLVPYWCAWYHHLQHMRLTKSINIITIDLAKGIETIRQITPISFPDIIIISSKKQALEKANTSRRGQVIYLFIHILHPYAAWFKLWRMAPKLFPKRLVSARYFS